MSRSLDGATLTTLLIACAWPGLSPVPLSPWLFALAIALTLFRHYKEPAPSVATRCWRALTYVASADGRAVRWTVLGRLFVLTWAYLVVMVLGYALGAFQFRLSHNELLNLPARWDAGWYLGIARRGYRWDSRLIGHQQSIAFFPAFPILMRLAGEILTLPARVCGVPWLLGTGDTRVLWGGVLVALCCLAAATKRLEALASLLVPWNPSTGGFAALFLSTWPFAFFFGAPYSEALFLLASVGAFLAAARSQATSAALWGLVAGLTRSNGWALAPGLAVFAVHDRKLPSARWSVVALAPLAGNAIFSWYVWTFTGDPLSWAKAQSGWGLRVEPLGFVTHRFGQIGSSGLWSYLVSDPAATVGTLAVFVILWLLWDASRLGLGLPLFSLAYLAPAILLDLPAIGRMTSVMFPAFIALASRASRRWSWVIAAIFALLQLWMSARFYTWRTPF